MSRSGNAINIKYYEGLWDVSSAGYELAAYKKILRDGEVAQDTRTRLGQVITDLCKLSSKAMEFLGVTDGQFPNIKEGPIPELVVEKFERLIAITRDYSASRLRG